jgi:hypothetical protein
VLNVLKRLKQHSFYFKRPSKGLAGAVASKT